VRPQGPDGAGEDRVTRVPWRRARRPRVSDPEDHVVRVSTAAGERVLEVRLCDYVAGAVAAETSPDWPDEALLAQTVASRTFALHRLARPRSRRYDVVTTTLDQYFVLPHLVTERVRTLVERTRGQYLTAGPARRSPVAFGAFFHAACGGGTDLPSAVWVAAGDEHHEAATCAECRRSPRPWRAMVDRDEFLAAAGMSPETPGPWRVDVEERTSSGRFRLLRVTAGGQDAVVAADTLRAHLGYGRVRSARFSWAVSLNHLRLEGVGYGHGVGLCQQGARGMAASGASYGDILGHYYPRSRLVWPGAPGAS
jgi:stage II sporulation protein D